MIVTAVKLLAVTIIWFFALQVWDVATLQLLRVVRSAGGVARFLGGCTIGLAALILLYTTVPSLASEAFSTLAIATFLAALIAEFLIGDDVRSLFRSSPRR